MVLQKKFNQNKYSAQFVCDFIDFMHSEWCLIAYLPTSPLTVIMRRANHANKLKKLPKEQYKVYNHIERAQGEGILMSRLAKNVCLSSSKCGSIIKKVLEKENLTSHYTNPRTFQVFYHSTMYKPPAHRDGRNEPFRDPKGKIDDEFLNNILTVIQHQIKQRTQNNKNKHKSHSNHNHNHNHNKSQQERPIISGMDEDDEEEEEKKGVNTNNDGISIFELEDIIKNSGLTKNNNGLPLNHIETCIQLLMFENKINIIPSSIPKHELTKFITHSKNTFHHLIKGIQNIRNEQQEEHEMKIQKENKRKRRMDDMNGNSNNKYNPRKKRKIMIDSGEDVSGSGGGDVGDEVLSDSMKNIRKYGEIRFSYNNFFDSHECAFAEIPCQACPNASVCSDDGIVNPKDCQYLDAWLGLF